MKQKTSYLGLLVIGLVSMGFSKGVLGATNELTLSRHQGSYDLQVTETKLSQENVYPGFSWTGEEMTINNHQTKTRFQLTFTVTSFQTLEPYVTGKFQIGNDSYSLEDAQKGLDFELGENEQLMIVPTFMFDGPSMKNDTQLVSDSLMYEWHIQAMGDEPENKPGKKDKPPVTGVTKPNKKDGVTSNNAKKISKILPQTNEKRPVVFFMGGILLLLVSYYIHQKKNDLLD